MAFDQRLVAFDMDGTLVTGLYAPLENCPHRCIPVQFAKNSMYFYIRPYMAETLVKCRNDLRNTVILFSAGDFEYVHAVVSRVINPCVREIDPDFSFAGIYTRDDMGGPLIKPIGTISQLIGMSESILVDDAWEYCLGSGATCYHLINPFDPEKTADVSLLSMMDKNFFQIVTPSSSASPL